MKKFIISLLIVAAFVAIPVSVFAQVGLTNDEVTGVSASARIITPISITMTEGAALNFGTLTTPSVETVVSIDYDADRSATPDNIVEVSDLFVQPSVPSFTVKGEVGAAYSVTFPLGNITITGTGAPMTVSNFASNATGTLTTGEEVILVKADLTVNANQLSGAYSGSFDVKVNYN